MGKSLATLKRYTRDLLKSKLFRFVSWDGDSIRVFYSSLVSSMRNTGHFTEAVWVRCGVSDIRRIKLVITEGVAKHLQRHSRYRASLEHGIKKAFLPKFDQISQPPSNPLGAMGSFGKVFRKGAFAFVSETFATWGGAQQTIADYLGISRESVCNRLSDDSRELVGLRPLERVQLAQSSGLTPNELHLLETESGGELTDGNTRFFVGPLGKVYHYCPNVYDFNGVELTSKKFRRRALGIVCV